ncbi:MAG TPA: MarR family transcriptional regulator [Chloroflexota bacterium]|nr:MarR family transcriptional regulator [Chloroflexota bacterium]
MQDIQESIQPDAGALLQGLVMVAHEVDERLNTALERIGLSVPKMTVLRILVQAGEPLPLGVVSERFGCVKSNITQLVDRLEADRLVRRIPDPADRRSILAAITEEGRRRLLAGQADADRVTESTLNGLSIEDRGQLERLLGLVRQAGERPIENRSVRPRS